MPGAIINTNEKQECIYMGQMIYFDMYRREEGDTMCKVLEKIHNKTAEELLKEYDVYDSLPIDLEKLVTSIGLSVLPVDFTLLEEALNKKRYPWSGTYIGK